MTINFAKLGKPKKNGTYQVYLRYQFKHIVKFSEGEKKTSYQYIPTKIFLSGDDMEKLLTERLTGKQYYQLEKFKETVTDYVTDYFKQTKRYPSVDAIFSGTVKKEEVLLEKYFRDYQKELKTKVKESTFKTHEQTIMRLFTILAKLSAKNKKDYNTDALLFASKVTTQEILNQYIEDDYNNGYIRTSILLLVRIQNFIREKLGLEPFDFKLNLKSSYKQFELTEEELDIIINYKTENKNYKLTQQIVKINRLLGLRIDEILNIHAEDIRVFPDHLLIQIVETKKNREREVITIDHDVINLLMELKNKTNEGKLFHKSKDDFNYYLKRIARYSKKFDDSVIILKHVGNETKQERKKRYQVVSSHNIRAFAITNNAKQYGLLTASYFSGHTDLRAMQKHYLYKIKTPDILNDLKNGGTKSRSVELGELPVFKSKRKKGKFPV